MKKILLGLLLLTSLSHAQNISYHTYTPLVTKHFNQSEAIRKIYGHNEGGNSGLIVGRRNTRENYHTEIDTGVFNNSFGKQSFTIQYGIGLTLFKEVDVTVLTGIATNYSDAYKGVNVPKWVTESGLLPTIGASFELHDNINIGHIQVTPVILINPTYINVGIRFRLGGNKKIINKDERYIQVFEDGYYADN